MRQLVTLMLCMLLCPITFADDHDNALGQNNKPVPPAKATPAVRLDPDQLKALQQMNAEQGFKPLKQIKSVPVVVPASFMARAQTVWVLLWLDVDQTGFVTHTKVRLSSGNSALDAAAQDAAMQSIYQPYIDPATGQAIPSRTSALMRFQSR